MKRVLVNITEQCNLNCSFCYVYPKRKNILDTDVFIDWISKYKNFFKEDIEISFYGGEPILQITELIKIISTFGTEVKKYTLGTNLVYDLTNDIINTCKNCYVITSWDPISLRFKTKSNFELWKENCKIIKPDICTIVLNNEVLKTDPRDIFENCILWGFKKIHFQKLHNIGNAKVLNLSVPNWNEVDDWLCSAYEFRLLELKVILFEDYINSCIKDKAFENWNHKCAGDSITIQSDGSISGCCLSTAETFSSIYESLETLYTSKKYKFIMNTASEKLVCRICSFYQYCNSNCLRLKWNNNICPFPKKLFRKILEDYNPNILSSVIG